MELLFVYLIDYGRYICTNGCVLFVVSWMHITLTICCTPRAGFVVLLYLWGKEIRIYKRGLGGIVFLFFHGRCVTTDNI
ncbi:hypothetical protein L1887_36549 [Cichorium endivia]|nr:hypothetical protein L1887_36549 [Cichorium endivia]